MFRSFQFSIGRFLRCFLSRPASRPREPAKVSMAITIVIAAMISVTAWGGHSIRPSITDARPGTRRAIREKRFEEIFEALDTNHDGFISREELAAAFHGIGSQRAMPEIGMTTKLNFTERPTRKQADLNKFRKLTPTQQEQLIKEAFETKPDRTAADQQRISKDEFRKIVIGPDRDQNHPEKTTAGINSEPAIQDESNSWDLIL